jgi:hypothetical protein
MLDIATQVMKFSAATVDLVRRARRGQDFSPHRAVPPDLAALRKPLLLEIVPLTFAVDLLLQRIEVTMRAINYTRRTLDLQTAVIDQLSVSDLPALRHIPGVYLSPINRHRSAEITFERALADNEVRAFGRAAGQTCPLRGSVRFTAHARAGRKPLRFDSRAALIIVGWVHGSSTALQN